MGLQQVERRLERLVEGVFSKAFRGGLQPVELARRLVREMEAGRTVSTRGTVAPNHAVITLSEDDAERFESFADALILELEDAMREHARDRQYRFIGPVKVELFQDPDFSKSQHTVVVEVRQGPGGMPSAALVLADGSRIAIGEDPVTIGRSPESTVKLTDSTVSRNHAQIVRDGDAWFLRDVGSSNGTKVNGAAIADHILGDGDEIKIGAVTLRFEMSVVPDSLLTILRLLLLSLIWLFFVRVLFLLAAKPKAVVSAAPVAPTWATPAAAPVAAAPSAPRKSSDASLRVVSGGPLANKEFTVGSEATIGRGQGCQVQLPDPMVSQLHARVFRADRGLHIEDLGSTNGTYLNGRKVGGPAGLKKGDRVRVGPIELEVLG